MADTNRVAVGVRPRHPADADRAGGARRILNDHNLPERCSHPLRHDARNSVGRAARRVGHDHRHRPRWIALRACETGQTRERGGARSQMQKLPSVGKFHGVYSLKGRSRPRYVQCADWERRRRRDVRQVDFQSARPPPAQALPLKTWDFGTSPPGSSIQMRSSAYTPANVGGRARRPHHQ